MKHGVLSGGIQMHRGTQSRRSNLGEARTAAVTTQLQPLSRRRDAICRRHGPWLDPGAAVMGRIAIRRRDSHAKTECPPPGHDHGVDNAVKGFRRGRLRLIVQRHHGPVEPQFVEAVRRGDGCDHIPDRTFQWRSRQAARGGRLGHRPRDDTEGTPGPGGGRAGGCEIGHWPGIVLHADQKRIGQRRMSPRGHLQTDGMWRELHDWLTGSDDGGWAARRCWGEGWPVDAVPVAAHGRPLRSPATAPRITTTSGRDDADPPARPPGLSRGGR